MAMALRVVYPRAFYHVMCRRTHVDLIFPDDNDLEAFLKRLGTAGGFEITRTPSPTRVPSVSHSCDRPLFYWLQIASHA